MNYAPDGSVIIEIGLDYGPAEKKAEEAKKVFVKTGEALEKAANPKTAGLDEYRQKQDKLNQVAESSRTSINKLQEAQRNLNALYKTGSIGKEQYEQLKTQIFSTTQEIKNNESQLKQSIKAYDSNAEKVEQLTGRLGQLDAQLTRIQEETAADFGLHEIYKNDDAALEAYLSTLLSSNSAFGKLSAEAEKTEAELEKYKQKMGEASEASAEFEQRQQEASKSADQLSKSLSEQQQEASRTAEELKQITKEQNQEVKQLNYELGLLAAAGVAAMASITDSIGKFRDFSAEFRKVPTLLDDSIVSLGKARDAVYQIAKDAGQSAEDLASGLYDALSASIDTADALDFLEVAAQNARAGFTDAATSVDVLSSTINAYGISASDVLKVSDKLLVTQNKGKLVIDDLSSGFGDLAAIASNAGVSLDEVLAALAAMTAQGIAPTTAINNLKQVLSAIINPTKQASDAASELGLRFDAQTLKTRGLAATLEDLQRKTRGNVDEIGELFGSVRALTGVLSITGQGADTFKDTLIELQNATGATAKAFDIVSSDPATKFEDALNRINVKMIEVGEAFAPVLNILAGFLNLIAEIDPQVLAIILTLTAAAGAVASFSLAITAIGKVFPNFNFQMQKTAITIIAVVAALTALVAVIAILAGKGDDLNRVGQNIESAVSATTSGVNRAQGNYKPPGYASGTNYNAQDGWYMVGENGPEIVYLTRGTGVLNSTQTSDIIRTMTAAPTGNFALPSPSGVKSFSAKSSLQQPHNYAYIDNRKISVRSIDSLQDMTEWFNNRDRRAWAAGR